MASFFEDLWNSVFTPGPTPPLLLATNATFACLQLLLTLLIFFAYSIHFVVLFVLSGGLWFSINWFAAELQASTEEEARKKAALEKKTAGRQSLTTAADADDEADDGDDTETELDSRRDKPVTAFTSTSQPSGTGISATSSELLKPAEAVRRRKSLSDSAGDLSTDSEWEKVG